MLSLRPGLVCRAYRVKGRPRLAPIACANHFRRLSGTPDGPLKNYEKLVQDGELIEDEFQRGIVQQLQTLHDNLTEQNTAATQHGLFSSFFESAPQPVKGMYLYGDVGCGKTMLMDMFYNTLPVKKKKRVHYHAFMQDIHKQNHQIKYEKGYEVDAMPIVAGRIADEAAVLCLDEFQVTDIADASLLRSLLAQLFKTSTLVLTSNRHPKELYKNGVQRQSFMPCIEMLQEKLQTVCLDSPTDYRRRPQSSSHVYHSPLDDEAVAHANAWFRTWGGKDPPKSAVHEIWGRQIRVPKVSGKCARISFDELCRRPLSAADYIALCRIYNAFIIENIPSLTIREKDVARRFITFVDTAYESRAKVAITSAVPINEIFVDDDEKHTSLSSAVSKRSLRHDPSNEEKDLDPSMRQMMDDLGMSMDRLRSSSIFTGEEERFAFARALSRIYEMGSSAWQR